MIVKGSASQRFMDKWMPAEGQKEWTESLASAMIHYRDNPLRAIPWKDRCRRNTDNPVEKFVLAYEAPAAMRDKWRALLTEVMEEFTAKPRVDNREAEDLRAEIAALKKETLYLRSLLAQHRIFP